jgi:hypothetical protein
MIKINKAGGYLIGLLLALTIYFIGQLLFFVNSEKAVAKICDIQEIRTPGRIVTSYDLFYVCFVTKDNLEIKANAGSNFRYVYGEQVTLRYRKANPTKIRIDEFSAMWLIHCWPYVIVLGFIMAAVTAAWYGTKYVVIYRNPFGIKLENA